MIGSGPPQPGSERVTLVAIDCVNHLHALRALNVCLDQMAFADAVFLSDKASPYTLAGCRMVDIPRIESADDYSRFVIKELGRYFDTSHVLVVQWDGYVLDPSAWRPEYLEHDFIGAPWGWYEDGHRVGNGGFSLRSRRLLDALQDPEVTDCVPEDEAIGRRYRSLLESRHGIRFAPESLAAAFSFETTYPAAPTFGFHGLFNMWMVLHPDEVAPFVGALHPTVIAGPQYLRLAGNYHDAGRLKEAIVVLTRRTQLNPADADAATLLAQWQAETRVPSSSKPSRTPGRNDPCPCGSGKRYKACCGSIASTPLPVRPDPRATLDRAMALHQAGNLVEAEALYHQVLAEDASNFIAIQYLGVLSLQKGDAMAAEALVRQALAQKEDIPEFHSNLGLCLRAQGRLEEAVAAYRRAIWLRPDYAAAYNNLGLDLQALGRVDHAVAAFEDAITHAPDLAEAHWNLGLALLLQGRFEKGWAEYEWRLRCQPFERHRLVLPGARQWQGETLSGCSLLVRQEQGAGDTVQFLRFVPRLASLASRVVVETAPNLTRLVEASLPGVSVVGPGEATAADFYVSLLSVPGRLGVTLRNVPGAVPYLGLDPTAGLGLTESVMARAGLRVGLAWSGNPAHANDRNRSCPPDSLEPLFAVQGCEWFSLQKGRKGMPSLWANRVVDLGSSFGDFADTATAIDALDLVITVDTSIAHIAGALAKPVWILLPFSPDWRWLLGRIDSPWYPTARLFRQPAIGDWGSVVAEVARALAEQVGKAPGRRR